MRGNFTKLLAPLLGIEGGVADRSLADDPGGLTNAGVTQKTYDAYRAAKGLPKRSVREIRRAEVTEIYREQYWKPIKGDKLPSGLDWAVFDFAVNSGVGRAVKELQRVLGCNVDGIVGIATLQAVEAADTAKTINHLCDRRMAFLRGLKNWRANRNGWTRRVAEVRAHALDMADEATPAPEKVEFTSLPASAAVRAPEAAQAQLKTADGAGYTAAAAGSLGQTALAKAQDLQPHVSDTVLGRAAIAACVLLTVAGFVLLGWSLLRKVRERGGLGGYIGSVFKEAA